MFGHDFARLPCAATAPLSRQPVENFCVGHDDKIHVDDYAGKALFRG